MLLFLMSILFIFYSDFAVWEFKGEGKNCRNALPGNGEACTLNKFIEYQVVATEDAGDGFETYLTLFWMHGGVNEKILNF
jgi:hypothetical protein